MTESHIFCCQLRSSVDRKFGFGELRTTDFTLDTVNNRTAVDDTLGTNHTEHDAAYTLNNLHQYSSLTYGGSQSSRSHDEAGNLTDDGAAAKFLWDYNDRLSEITDRAQTPNTIATYIYDALGRRALKTVGTAKTRYIYNGPGSPSLKDGWQCIEEYEGTGSTLTLTRTYVYGNNIDEVLQVKIGNDKYYYHTNAQGNVAAITNNAGAVVETFKYDIYGRLTGAEAWNGSAKVAVIDGDFDGNGTIDTGATADGFVDREYLARSVIDNSALFQGRNYDAESGLYYFRNRQYDPIHGRFLSRDPMGYADSMCLYSFVNNNPICYVDPYGLWKITVWLPENRALLGDLILYNKDGKPLLYAPVKGKGTGGDWWQDQGDTPTGNWKGELNGKRPDTAAYGPYEVIALTAVSGHAKEAVTEKGRWGFLIHSGRTQDERREVNVIDHWDEVRQEDGTVTYVPVWVKKEVVDPRPTWGCLRISNVDQQKLVSFIKGLTSDECGEDKEGDVIISGTQAEAP